MFFEKTLPKARVPQVDPGLLSALVNFPDKANICYRQTFIMAIIDKSFIKISCRILEIWAFKVGKNSTNFFYETFF